MAFGAVGAGGMLIIEMLLYIIRDFQMESSLRKRDFSKKK